MSDNYCFRRAAQRQLSECIRRNTATVLRVVVKSHNGLKGAKVLACGRARVGTFYCKLQPIIAYKRLLRQLYRKRDTETLSQAFPVNFEEKL